MTSQVCVDASLALLWLLPGQWTPAAESLLTGWNDDGVTLVSVPLFDAEVTSTLRDAVYSKRLSPERGEELFRTFERLRVDILFPSDLRRLAWDLARQFDQRGTYDMQYVALSRLLGCELWTADRKLLSAVRGQAPWVMYVEQGAR